MRTLTPATEAATQLAVTTPAWLVEISWSSVVRLSSRGDQSWNGFIWVQNRLGAVTLDQRSAVVLMDSDLAMTAAVLNEGSSDIACRIWKFYGDSPAVADPVLVFDGVVDGAEMQPGTVRLTLASENQRTMQSPRRFIGPQTGFNHLRPAGSTITWGGETYVLERSS